MASSRKERASERWKFLRDALVKKTFDTSSNVHSVRRVSTFNLFKVHEDGGGWSKYTYSPLSVHVKVCLITAQDFSLKDLTGFNNTGNICIWPSEEIMAYYCLENIHLFKDKTICELGAGMTGLAGLFLAATHAPHHILLTDGNEKSIDNLNTIITANDLTSNTSASLLRWQSDGISQEHSNYFDVIICGDCFFFTDVQTDLLLVMFNLLKLHGKAYLFGPERSGTFKLFIQKAYEYFNVQVTCSDYHSLIEERHQDYIKTNSFYNPDLHYPYLVVLERK